MLDLDGVVRVVDGVELGVDDAEQRRLFVLPPPPTVAIDAGTGRPAVELLRFVDAGGLGGGHLDLAVELAHPAERLAAAQRAMEEALGGEVTLVPVPVLEASATLDFVGREPTADGGLSGMVRRSFGSTPAQVVPPHRAALSVELTPAGAGLVEAALRSGGAPIGVTYRLGLEGLWPALRVVGRVDWDRVYEHLSMHARSGALLEVSDIQRITERLVEERVVVLSVVEGMGPADGTAPSDPGPVLTWIQRELVERCCEPVLALAREPARVSLGTAGEVFGVGERFALKARTQIESSNAEIDFTRRRVLTRTATVHAHLADLLGNSPVEDHIVDAHSDHPFFQRMRLEVDAAQPLVDRHLREIVLDFTYGSAHETRPLDAEHPSVVFETWADASAEREWGLRAEATFADDSPLDPGGRVVVEPIRGRSRALTLDLDRLLGFRTVAVRPASDERVLLSRVRVSHHRNGEQLAEAELRLAPAQPEQVAWFRGHRTGDRVEAEVQHLLSDGRLIDLGAALVETTALVVPPPFPGSMTVQVLADDWTGIERIVVALQRVDAERTATVELTTAGPMAAVALDLPDPTDRSYRYRTSRTLTGGVVEEDGGWITTDASVLLIGAVGANELLVDLRPVGPELPQAGIRLIEVELLYLDVANRIAERATELVRAVGDRPRWRIDIADPQQRQYEYRITVHRLDGRTQVGPWTVSRDRILPIPVTTG